MQFKRPRARKRSSLCSFELKGPVVERRRRVCSSLGDEGPATVADRCSRKTGAALERKLEHCGPERPGQHDSCRLLVRSGNFELSVIRPGGRRIGQPINRCHHDKQGEQQCQAPDRPDRNCPGSSHCESMHCVDNSTNKRPKPVQERILSTIQLMKCVVDLRPPGKPVP
jgi:hypothetical protein